MRIDDLLRAGTTLSFEFFPPKTDEAAEAFAAAYDDLAGLHPDFTSVTYGALGSTRGTTESIVHRVNAEHPFPTMPHLTCSGHTRDELAELITSYRNAGVRNILALAGDPPTEGSDAGDFVYATELIELIRSIGDFAVGVAAFPELHPRSTDRAEDRRRLAEKLELADFGMTQFFWDSEHYLRMRDELAALGCDKPLVPGVMPFVSVPGTRRMSAINGTNIPADLEARLDRVDGDAQATRALGIEVAVQLCAELLEAGVPGLHLYTMNRAASVREVTDRLGLRAAA
ncbi:MAG: methylenetetrahydrofolate reductase [Patulibacter sp.]